MSRAFCYKCHRSQDGCICHTCTRHKTYTHFVILIHPMERQKVKNGTGRMTHLQLENSSMIYGTDFNDNKNVNELINKYNCALLYPGESSINLSSKSHLDKKEAPEYIFILDATWPAAKKMLKLSPSLQSLPRVSFSHNIESEFIIKQQPHKLCLSTIESVHILIKELKRLNIESSNLELEHFLDPFREMIRFQLECIRNPNNNHHHHVRKTSVTPKTMYKKEGGRKLFFEE